MSSSAVLKSPPRPAGPTSASRPGAARSSASRVDAAPVVPAAGEVVLRPWLRVVRGGEAGTTTAEYTVVTAAAVAFGALLLKLLTGGWGEKILSTAFREVIKMLGF